MTSIILHSSDEIFLIKMQKAIINKLYDEKITAYRHVPLWIDLPDFDIQNTKKNIEEVLILSPEYSEKENKIFCKVLITIAGQTVESKLPLIDFLTSKNIDKKKETNQIDLSPFEISKKLTVFRIGKTSKTDKNCYELEAFVWKKL